ncbi:hypothetical protein [Terrisporobacter muris]|jgi:hypothetical protein|uniref:Uncharacterized protein n=1 Tax=Terrisporobacter muris TaxID=2963284 RepID=A0A9X2M7Q0_9FIRM|nr:hypothetical protein [Terrisporobacter muris]MCR1822412.1 hypothetical protein [Terrisporobacter muris]
MGLRIENLKVCFKNAKINNFKYIGIKVWMADFEKCEVIINPIENFDKKLEYYQVAYNDDLTLKSAQDKVKIVGFTYGNSYQDIEDDLESLKIIF